MAVLNKATSDPLLCKKRPEFNGAIGVLLSTNDILVLKDDNILSVQAKNHFFGEGLHKKVDFTGQDYSLLTNLAEGKGSLLDHGQEGAVIASKAFSTKDLLEECINKSNNTIELLSKAEERVRDASQFTRLREDIAEKAVSNEKTAVYSKGMRIETSVPSSANDISNNK